MDYGRSGRTRRTSARKCASSSPRSRVKNPSSPTRKPWTKKWSTPRSTTPPPTLSPCAPTSLTRCVMMRPCVSSKGTLHHPNPTTTKPKAPLRVAFECGTDYALVVLSALAVVTLAEEAPAVIREPRSDLLAEIVVAELRRLVTYRDRRPRQYRAIGIHGTRGFHLVTGDDGTKRGPRPVDDRAARELNGRHLLVVVVIVLTVHDCERGACGIHALHRTHDRALIGTYGPILHRGRLHAQSCAREGAGKTYRIADGDLPDRRACACRCGKRGQAVCRDRRSEERGSRDRRCGNGAARDGGHFGTAHQDITRIGNG